MVKPKIKKAKTEAIKPMYHLLLITAVRAVVGHFRKFKNSITINATNFVVNLEATR